MPALAPTRRTLLIVFAALIVLLALSAAAAQRFTGTTGTLVALGFAVAKTVLIFLFFMRLRYQSALVRLFAVAGFLWATVAALLTMTDYLTRG